MSWIWWIVGTVAAPVVLTGLGVGGFVLWRWWRGYMSSYKFKFHDPNVPLDKNEIRHNFEFMIGLEVGQVKMFRYQAAKLRRAKAGDYLVAFVDAAARIEHVHVRRLRSLYRELFGRAAPSRLGHAAGWVTILMSAMLPERWMAKWDAWSEQLAIAHYERVVAQAREPAVRRMFLEHAADERSHLELFKKWELHAQ
ncbi:MAG: ferritin family protein [Kyrpidia sp.]|nr:ferritin family protein [Kyrpidia sp.]